MPGLRGGAALTRLGADEREVLEYVPSRSAARTTCSPVRIGGGRRAALIHTIVQTATLNGLDPEAYRRDVLGRIADRPINRIGELLPWKVAAWPTSPASGSTSTR